MAEKQTQSSEQRPQVQEQEPRAATSEKGEQQERGIARRAPAGTLARSPSGARAFGWPRSPFSLMRRMMEDMDRMFGDGGFGELGRAPMLQDLLPMGGGGPFVPAVEVSQRGDALVVRADLPGIKREDIHVTCDEGGLVIEGERKTSSEEAGEGYFQSECSYGSFRRQIPLPRGADVQSCDATFEDGVLEIQVALPKASGRKIEVKPRGAAAEGQREAATSGGETKESGVRH